MTSDLAYTYKLLGPQVRIRALKKDAAPVSGYASSLPALVGVAEMSLRGWDCYVGLNPVTSMFRQQTSANIAKWRYLLIDLDPQPGPVTMDDAIAVSRNVDELIGRSVGMDTIESGRGIHFWLRIKQDVALEPLRIAAASRNFLQLIAPNRTLMKVDPSTGDLARIARLPGSFNQRSGKLAKFVYRTGGRGGVRASEILQFAPAQQFEVVEDDCLFGSWREAWSHLTPRAQHFIESGDTSGSRHESLWHTGRKLRELGVSRNSAAEALFHAAELCQPMLESSSVARVLREEWRNGVSNQAEV